MKRKTYTEEKIIAVLKEAESGVPVKELCRKHGMASASFYAWKRKYGGMEVSEAKRLKQLENGHRRLKAMVGDQALDIQVLKAITGASFVLALR